MSTAIFSAPKFVKIESSDKKQMFWWPSFAANSWKELMNVLCTRSKALASLSYMKIDMEKRNSDHTWIYLVGETLPFEKSRLIMVDEAQLGDLILDFYDNLDTMCVKHASFEHWNNACEEISRWIEGKNLELLKVSKFSEDTLVTNVSTEVSSFLENDTKIHEHAKLEADALIHPKKPTRTNTSSRATPKDKKASSKDVVSGSYRKDRVITSISTNPSDSMGLGNETFEDKHIAVNKVKRDRPGSLKTVKTSISTSAKKLNGEKKAALAANVTLATPNLNPYSRNFPDRQEALLYAHSNIQTPVNSASPSSSIGTKLSSKEISTKRIGTEIGVDAKKVSPSDASKSTFPPLEKKYFPVNEEFENVLQTLKDRYGWRVIKGSKSSLVKLYYVTGRYADSSIHHIQNVLTLNEDYFKSADAVKVFLRKKVGWRGPAPMKPLSPTAAPAEIEKHLETAAPAEIEEQLETVAPAETVKIEKHLRFVTVWKILQSKYGFHYRASSLWFWNGTSKGKKLADLKANEDYFETEEDLKQFVHKKFGWVGPQGKEFYPVYAAGRANRRTRNNFGETKVIKNTSLAPQSASKVDLRDVLSDEVTVNKPSTKEPVLKKRKTNEKMAKEIITSPHDSSTLRKSTKGRKNVRDPKPRTSNISVDTHQDENKARSRMSATKAKEVNIGRLKRDDRGASPDSSDLARKTKPRFSAHHMNIGEVKEDYNNDERDLPLKAKLENCSKSLCISNTSDDILFTGTDISSNFFVAKDRIVSFLEKCISKNIDPKHSSVLNICGRPGTGKTTMIQHCLRTMQDSGEYPEFNSTFLNAASISSYGKLIEEIAMALGKKPNITIPMIEKKLSYKMTAPLIVVVDEIDFLIGGHRQSKSKEESPIDTVFRWASKSEFALTLICISNSVGDENAKLLHKMVKVGEEVIFRTYSEADLISIIKRRLGIHTNLIDPRAMTFVARKVAKLDGDARLVLDLMSSSIITAKESLSAEMLEQKSTDKPLVNLPHVMKAIKTSGAIPLVDHINALPSKAKTILAIATTLGQVSSSWSVIRLNQLKKYCAEATRHEIFDELSTEGFYSIIGQLEDAGLIISADSDDVVRDIGFDDPGEKPIRVGVQMDDVEIALEKTLFTEGSFYTKLRDYVKSNDIENVGCNY